MSKSKHIKLDSKGQKKFQAYTLYTTTALTQEKIAEKLGVSRSTVVQWLNEVREVIDEKAILASAATDLLAAIPAAVQNITRAVVKDNMIGYLASKDLLKNKDLLKDKVQIEHEFPQNDEDLLNELTSTLNGRLAPVKSNGQKAGSGHSS
jgi:transcriptional regulator with XRE-family HTH domain